MNYYLLDVGYRGVVANLSSIESECGKQADKDLQAAIERLEILLDNARVEWKHAYAWPDGSLYVYIKDERDRLSLRDHLSIAFNDDNLAIRHLSPEQPDTKVFKANCETLEEYFDFKEDKFWIRPKDE